MKNTKITVLSAIAVAMLGTASFAVDEPPIGCLSDCEPSGLGNPGNGKEVGRSPWDGITGNSGRNGINAPSAGPINENGQAVDTPFPQPGGKGDGPSPQE
jgi:hypothetical protein